MEYRLSTTKDFLAGLALVCPSRPISTVALRSHELTKTIVNLPMMSRDFAARLVGLRLRVRNAFPSAVCWQLNGPCLLVVVDSYGAAAPWHGAIAQLRRQHMPAELISVVHWAQMKCRLNLFLVIVTRKRLLSILIRRR